MIGAKDCAHIPISARLTEAGKVIQFLYRMISFRCIRTNDIRELFLIHFLISPFLFD